MKERRKKQTCIFLCVLMLCSCLAACNRDTPSEGKEDQSVLAQQPADTEPAAKESTLLELARDGKSDYVIVYALNTPEELGEMKKLIQVVEEKSGATIPYYPENKRPDIGEKEILIGDLKSRPASCELMAVTDYTERRISIKDKSPVVCAYSVNQMMLALQELCAAVTVDENGVCGIPADYQVKKGIANVEYYAPKYEGNGTMSGLYEIGDRYELNYTGINADGYRSYLETLTSNGYESYTDNAIGDNLFATYIKDDGVVHLAYYPSMSSMRVSVGKKGFLPPTEAPEYTAVVTPSVTQIGRVGAANSAAGMSLIVQLADGSYIIVDGGPYKEELESDKTALLDFLKANNPTEGKPRVTWMFTHAHSDHMQLALQFLTDYYKEIELTTVCYNFPDFMSIDIPKENAGKGNSIQFLNLLNGLLNRYYPKADRFVFHSGEKLYLPGCEIEILLTHEDYWPQTFTYINHTSSAWRMTVGGKSIVVLGDCEKGLCQQMASVYGTELKSDILQITHHGLNGAHVSLYKVINPSVCFWPIDKVRFETDPRCLGTSTNYDFNKWLRDDPSRRHYHASETVTITLPDLQVRE